MANYKKITDVEVMEGVTENSMALVNENGVLKQVSCGAGFGGGGVKTAIIKQDGYDNALAGVAAAASNDTPEPSYTCTNMTFDEAVSVIMSGEPLNATMFAFMETTFAGINALEMYYVASGTPCIQFVFRWNGGDMPIFWTADGISFTDPNGAL